jgi:H+/gluconate symporter-like permease
VISSWRRTCVVSAIVAALLAPAGCQRDDSFLLVEVAGDLMLAPAQLRATVIVGYRSTTFFVPPEPTAISLPTSFTVELDRSITGPVTIAIDALDGGGYIVASGATTQTHISPGGQTIVTVTIAGVQP